MKRLSILAAMVTAILVTTSVFSATAVFAQTPTPTPTPTPNPGGLYEIVIDCGDGFYAGATVLTFTLNNTPVPNITPVPTLPLTVACSPGTQARESFKAPSDWNDSKVQYWCSATKPAAPPPPPPINTLDIPVPPRVVLEQWYALGCPSTGITTTPEAGTPGQPRIQFDRSPVGGVAEVSGAEASSLDATASGGSSTAAYAVIGGIAAGVLLLGTGGWYARRRWRAS